MNEKWSVFKGFINPDEAIINDGGSNGRGDKMSPKSAQEIVDSHNHCNDPKWAQDFSEKARQFLQDQFIGVVDTEHDSVGNYWRLISVMTASLTAQLQSAVNLDLVKLKPGIINHGELDSDPK